MHLKRAVDTIAARPVLAYAARRAVADEASLVLNEKIAIEAVTAGMKAFFLPIGDCRRLWKRHPDGFRRSHCGERFECSRCHIYFLALQI